MSTSPITVRFTPSGAIQDICDKNASHYALGNVYIEPVFQMNEEFQGRDAKGKPSNPELRPVNRIFTAATDGYILAIAKTEGLAVDPALCPMKLAKPGGKKTVKRVELNGRWETSDGIVAPVAEGRFPKIKEVLPKCEATQRIIRLDARQLAQLQAALNEGSDTIALILPEKATDPICVVGDNGIGVMMGREREGKAGPCPIDEFEAMRVEFQENQPQENEAWRAELVKRALNPNSDPLVKARNYITEHQRATLNSFVVFRRGDRYEAFGADAVALAKHCGIPHVAEFRGYFTEETHFEDSQLDAILATMIHKGFDTSVIDWNLA